MFTNFCHQYGDGKTLYSLEHAINNEWWEYVSIHYPTLEVISQYKDKLYWNYIINRVKITDEFFVKYTKYLLPWAIQILKSAEDNIFLSEENLEVLKKQCPINIASKPKRKSPITKIC
jgi:hypothetical protein